MWYRVVIVGRMGCTVPSVAEVGVAEDEAAQGVEEIDAEGPVEKEQQLGAAQLVRVRRLGIVVLCGWKEHEVDEFRCVN